MTKEKKVVDLTKDEKRKKTVIELSDDEDDKPPPPAPKAKAKRNPQKLTKPGLKAVRKISKSKQPPPKDEKRKTVIELSDDEDKAPKAKAAPNLRKIKKQVKEYQKFIRPKPKNKLPVEAEPEKTGQKREKEVEIQIKETPIAAPKKRAKKTSEKENDAKDLFRAIRKASKRPAKGPEDFL